MTRVLQNAEPVTSFFGPHPAVRANLEAFGRAVAGEATYPVTHEEMLANVRSFEAIQRSILSGNIEKI